MSHKPTESIAGSVCYLIFFGNMSRNARVGENGENSAKVLRIFIWGSKGFPLRVAILAKWYIWRIRRKQSLSKTSNEMAKGQFESGDFNKNGALSPKFGECSYDVAKAPLWEWRFWRKWQILRTPASFRKNSNEMAKRPFESGDLHENVECGENSSKP